MFIKFFLKKYKINIDNFLITLTARDSVCLSIIDDIIDCYGKEKIYIITNKNKLSFHNELKMLKYSGQFINIKNYFELKKQLDNYNITNFASIIICNNRCFFGYFKILANLFLLNSRYIILINAQREIIFGNKFSIIFKYFVRVILMNQLKLFDNIIIKTMFLFYISLYRRIIFHKAGFLSDLFSSKKT